MSGIAKIKNERKWEGQREYTFFDQTFHQLCIVKWKKKENQGEEGRR